MYPNQSIIDSYTLIDCIVNSGDNGETAVVCGLVGIVVATKEKKSALYPES